MSLIDRARRVLQEDRADFERRLGRLEAGELRTGERHGPNEPWFDTTAASIVNARRKIAEIDAILGDRNA